MDTTFREAIGRRSHELGHVRARECHQEQRGQYKLKPFKERVAEDINENETGKS